MAFGIEGRITACKYSALRKELTFGTGWVPGTLRVCSSLALILSLVGISHTLLGKGSYLGRRISIEFFQLDEKPPSGRLKTLYFSFVYIEFMIR